MKKYPCKQALQGNCHTATTAGWCWLIVLVLVLLCTRTAKSTEQGTQANLKTVVCRVSNHLRGANNLGSGTLIDKTDDGREGLVLTCAHLFSEGTGEVLIRFADGKSHQARLIDLDVQADLAALAIAFPSGQPAEVVFERGSQAKLQACGYGPRGIYRCAVGPQVGEAVSAGQMSLLIGDSVRSGDSGGGVFDERGRLVAVIWGEAQGVTYASYGQPLRRFLNRVLGRKTSLAYSCPGRNCPQRPRSPLLPKREESIVVDSRWSALQEKLQRQIDELRARKQDRGDYLTRGELPDLSGYARQEDLSVYARREAMKQVENEATSRHAGLLSRIEMLNGRTVGRTAGAAAVGLLGLSGPAGWAVITAASVGGWLIGRRVKRTVRGKTGSGAGGRRRRRFRG